jgi:hypothetical protein
MLRVWSKPRERLRYLRQLFAVNSRKPEKNSLLLERIADQPDLLNDGFRAIQEGIDNQSSLPNNKLGDTQQGVAHRERLLDDKLGDIQEGIAHQLGLLNDRLGDIQQGIAHQSGLLNDKLGDIQQGIAHQSGLLNDKLGDIHQGIAHQSGLLNDKLGELHEGIVNQSSLLHDMLGALCHDLERLNDAVKIGLLPSRHSALLSETVGSRWSRDLLSALGALQAEVSRQLDTLNRRVRDLQEGMRHFEPRRSAVSTSEDVGSPKSQAPQPRSFDELEKIPFPLMELTDVLSLSKLSTSKSYQRCVEYFAADTREQLMLLAEPQAFLFSLIRTLKPQHVFEIGLHHRAITEAMCCALALNETGLLHVLSAGAENDAGRSFNDFPTESRDRARWYSADVVGFFREMRDEGIAPTLVIVNEPQFFDSSVILQCATGIVASGALILIRDGQRAEVSNAVEQFVSQHREWRLNAVFETAELDAAGVAHLPPLVGVGYAILFAP